MAESKEMSKAPWAPPPAYEKQEVGEPNQTAGQQCANEGIQSDALQGGWLFRIATWNIDSMTGKAGELVEAFRRRRVDVACVQESRWKGAGTRLFGGNDGRYKFSWQGAKDGYAGVGVFVAEKWIEHRHGHGSTF